MSQPYDVPLPFDEPFDFGDEPRYELIHDYVWEGWDADDDGQVCSDCSDQPVCCITLHCLEADE